MQTVSGLETVSPVTQVLFAAWISPQNESNFVRMATELRRLLTSCAELLVSCEKLLFPRLALSQCCDSRRVGNAVGGCFSGSKLCLIGCEIEATES